MIFLPGSTRLIFYSQGCNTGLIFFYLFCCNCEWLCAVPFYWMCNFEWWCVVFVIFPVFQIWTSCAIVSFECLRLLTLKPPLQMSICPQLCLYRSMNVLSPNLRHSKHLLHWLGEGVYSLLPLLQLAANIWGKKKKFTTTNMQPTTQRTFPSVIPTSLAIVVAVCQAVGLNSLTVVSKAGNSLLPWLCKKLVCLPQ